MEVFIIIALVAVGMVILGYYMGHKAKNSIVKNYQQQLADLKALNEKQLADAKEAHEKQLNDTKETYSNQLQEIKMAYEKQLTDAKEAYEKQLADTKATYEKQLTDTKEAYEKQFNDTKETYGNQLQEIKMEYEKQLTDTKTAYEKQFNDTKTAYEKQLTNTKEAYEKQLNDTKAAYEKQLTNTKEAYEKQFNDTKETYSNQLQESKMEYEKQLTDAKEAYEKQLSLTKEGTNKQIEALRQMNKEQVESQLKLIKEQMQTTSEEILKRRQEELGERNKEQVSRIIDPLQQSIKSMQEALDKSKAQQNEALTRLDETIKINMQKNAQLGETADRLTRALTGEVKVQGNFGELKLKQLLEDLELKEGEQFDTQETLRDKCGKTAKGDDGKGLIPDFILHFPNNRHVVVDSKMSLTDYERYMNAEDGSQEKSDYLKAHIASVRAQVKRLARKEYTRYLPEGYNKLNFAIMYVPIEGALNLALLNDSTLWREAYDDGVMILGPQTMYMNLRVLEMMWTQVRQLSNQQAMMDAANTIIDRVQDFGIRFADVETSMTDTIKKIGKLKITTANNGSSIITAARNLLKAGAKENKKKKSLADLDDSIFIESNIQEGCSE